LGQHEVDRFTVELRDFLDHARSERRFERLWLIAAPAFLGHLRSALQKPLRQRVDLEIDKDWTTDKADDILKRALERKQAKTQTRCTTAQPEVTSDPRHKQRGTPWNSSSIRSTASRRSLIRKRSCIRPP